MGEAMADRKNVDLLEKAYLRWHETRGGSVEDWMAIVDDDIQFGSIAERAPQMQFAADYDSRAALRSYFDGLLAEWEMIHFSMNEFIADGDMVVVRGSVAWRHKRTGKEVDTPKIDFWRFRNGKAIEFYEYFDTARAFAAASDDD
jgi:ketosteroid isomerase-like protein